MVLRKLGGLVRKRSSMVGEQDGRGDALHEVITVSVSPS